MERKKYPRTPHLPWSVGGVSNDDRVLRDTEAFRGRLVVVTEKIDGENCTIGRTGGGEMYTHARSLNSGDHPSRSWVKAFAARVAPDLPRGWRVCGENVYARHSISYGALPSYFLLFSIWDDQNHCLSWDATLEWAALLDLDTVPVIHRGLFDPDRIKACWSGESAFGVESEGYVVRVTDGFGYEDFQRSVAKLVRPNHVNPTASHWMRSRVTPNTLRD